MADSRVQSHKRTRRRAAKACRRCNVKRVKCDATQNIPCTRCRQSGITDCVLRQSRRGTYIRKSKREAARNTDGDAEATVGINDGNAHQYAQDCSGPSRESMESENQGVNVDDACSGRSVQSHIVDYSSTTSPIHLNQPVEEPAVAENGQPQQEEQQETRTSSSTTTPQMIRHQEDTDFASPSVSLTSVGSSSYREMPWSAMFDHFLNKRQDHDRREFIDKASITYLGESFPLAIILEDFHEGGMPKLHHPAPPYPSATPNDSQHKSSLQHPSHVPPQDIDYLTAKGAFEFPEKEQWESFMELFLERVFPIYPIFNRNELIQQFREGSIPPILIHSICFLVATFGPVVLLHRAGYSSRREARFSYYQKAKALFDAQYELNKLVILQTAIMMSFWGGGPNTYWNFYGWLSSGVTIAETLGLHRSMATTKMKPVDKSLLKRMWWVLVIRDAFCTSLVGRPFRIDIDQCDTEMLTLDDFAYDSSNPDFPAYRCDQSFAQYQIHMSKLSLILREIVQARFYPRKPLYDRSELHSKLIQWREQLPIELNWSENSEDISNVFSTTLAVCYHHNMILTYLGQTFPAYSTINDPMANYDGDMAHTSAEYIAGIMCIMVTKSKVHHMPHELFHAIFLAETKFYTEMRSPHPLISKLGCAALKNCQMVLHESCDAWDPSPWVMQLFENLVRRARDEQQNSSQVAGSITSPRREHNSTNEEDLSYLPWNNNALSTFDMDPLAGVLSYESWQNHPMLSNLFDGPQSMFNYGLASEGT